LSCSRAEHVRVRRPGPKETTDGVDSLHDRLKEAEIVEGAAVELHLWRRRPLRGRAEKHPNRVATFKCG
jgi:hypothetical protein